MIRRLNVLLVLTLGVLGAWLHFEDELRIADRKILFVGNSFTFGSNVPGMVQQMARSADPGVTYHVRMIAKPDYRLAQHIAEGTALAEIRSGVWDVVILQDQSAAPFAQTRRQEMQDSIGVLAGAAASAGAAAMVYAHWAPGFINAPGRDRAVEQIEHSYAKAAADVGAAVIPVGRLWQSAARKGVGPLYAADGHHASTLGVFAAAVAILRVLGDVDPATTTWTPPGLSPAAAKAVRDLVPSPVAGRRLPQATTVQPLTGAKRIRP